MPSPEKLTMSDGTEFLLTRTAEETGGESIEMEITLPPGAPSPPLHFHPRQEERWDALAGELTVHVGGRWRGLRPGESVTMVPGEPHTLRNDSAETVRVRDTHTPALDFEDYIRRLAALSQSGKLGSPRRLSTLIHYALLWREQQSQVAAQWPVRTALRLLAPVGRLLRYRTD
jgi:quercetin dioxygenase-like cupin family protein